jgi:acyl-CoA thioesterase-1
MASGRNIKVFFFGDSICVGQHVSIHRGWVTRLSAELSILGEKHAANITVTNASGNGRTTRDALDRIGYELQSLHPDVVIIQFGMNDCNYWLSDKGLPRVSPRSFQANLEEIIHRAHHFGASHVFLNTNHPTGLITDLLPHTETTYQQSNIQYNEIIRNVSNVSAHQVQLNDIEKYFLDKTGNDPDHIKSYLLPEPDLLHLNDDGHNLYFQLLYPVISKTIVELLNLSPT